MLSYITWNIQPEIFNGFYVRWYGLLFAVGYVISFYTFTVISKKENIPNKLIDKMVTYSIIGGIAGARLGHCLFYEPDVYLKNPLEILYIWKGGLASHGGAFGILLAFFILSKKTNVNFWWILSRTTIVIPIAGAFIRFGNLMNSEIYGLPTSLPWGFLFPQSPGVLYGNEVLEPRHPTQIYEALAYLLTGIFTITYYRRHVINGINNFKIIGIFLIGVFLSRFLLEFVKTNQVTFEEGLSLNMGQMLSIPFILFGIYCLFWGKNYSIPTPAEEEKNSDNNTISPTPQHEMSE